MAKKTKSRYKPKYKLGTEVIDIETKSIGTIKRIDNVCNLRDNKRSVPEYYIKWHSGWSRHDCYYFDNDILDPGNEFNPPQEKITVIPLTPAARVLYNKPQKIKKRPQRKGRRSFAPGPQN